MVRRIVDVRGDQPVFADVLGDLTALTGTEAVVATDAGPVTIPLSRITHAKPVPDRWPPSGPDIAAVERAAADAWPAPDTHRLGDWLLRSADGWTGRGNTALPLGDPGHPLPAAVDQVITWYAARGQPPMFNLPRPVAGPARTMGVLNPDLGGLLDSLGWATVEDSLVQTTILADLRERLGDGAAPVRLRDEPSAGWLAIAAGRKGGLPPAARHILTHAAGARTFAEITDAGGEVIAIGRGAVTGDGRWLSLALIEVVPQLRRRGLARQVIHALAGWAAEAGASRALLQVAAGNTPAVALYERLGFRVHHRYATRRLSA